MPYRHTIQHQTFVFADLKTLLAKASPLRSGDTLAGIAAASAQERVAAQKTLADLPLTEFLKELVIPYEADEVTRLIQDSHDLEAFAFVSHLTVGGLRDWLLSDAAASDELARLAPGLTAEMAAAVSKIMRVQDLILVAAKCRVITKFRNTIGLAGTLSTRIQPNHPTDDPRGVAASLLDGLLQGGGDAVIGINPATDRLDAAIRLWEMLDGVRRRLEIPAQTCVLSHITTTMQAMQHGAPVDLVFQSIAGTERANASFGINLALLREAQEMALALGRGTVGRNVMYFETGQGSALSAGAHHGVDQQTVEARAYAVARAFSPLLVNTVVGFIGPEYLFNGKQITRAGLEDHFCGKLLGLPMGCDICYTNHADADQDDMDGLLTLLTAAGCTFIMGVPGADDVMLNYQSTSFSDALYARRLLGRRPAPEFEAWQDRMGLRAGLVLSGPVADALDELQSTVPSEMVPAPSSLWPRLRTLTPARIGIAPTGVSLPTAPHLDFQWDHAQARDAVYSNLNAVSLSHSLEALGLDPVTVHSANSDRGDYLRRPDRGRQLDSSSRERLLARASETQIVFVLADGLSAGAVNRHAVPLLAGVLPALRQANLGLGPVVLAQQARVALGDAIAACLNAAMVVVLIGERPGLTAPDSLGVYLTWQPREDTTDAERNCISNIRPEGLSYAAAAHRLLYLITESRRRQLSGVALKEAAGDALAENPAIGEFGEPRLGGRNEDIHD